MSLESLCPIDAQGQLNGETTPRAILSYQQSEDVMFYASYSKGYSSGGFNGDVAMRRFLPETSDNYEGWNERRILR